MRKNWQLKWLTRAALLSLLRSHLHEGIQHQSIVQPGVPVLQLLQEVRSRGLWHFSGGQLTEPLDEARDVQQGYYWNSCNKWGKCQSISFTVVQYNTKCGHFEHCALMTTYLDWPLPVRDWHYVSAGHFWPTKCAYHRFQHQVLRWWQTGCGRS